MKLSAITTYVFIALALISALGILFTKSLFRAALFLLGVLLSVAAIYVLSLAEFLAVTQILIYAGGIVVVLIFGIMLSTKLSGKPLAIENTNITLSTILAGGLIFILAKVLESVFGDSQPSMPETNSVRQTGFNMLASHIFVFEVSGVLLLAALIGAIVISRATNHSQ